MLVFFFLLFYFLDLDVIIELKLNAEIEFFQITTWNALNLRQISGIRLFQFQIAVILLIKGMLYRVIQ